MKSPILVMLSCASVLVAGCAPINFVAERIGGALGARAAQALPTPPAQTIVDPKGGNFCDTTRRLGWPLLLTEREITTLTGKTLGVIVATDEHGARNCPGWAVPSS